MTQRETEGQRDRETEGQKDRETERQTDRQKWRDGETRTIGGDGQLDGSTERHEWMRPRKENRPMDRLERSALVVGRPCVSSAIASGSGPCQTTGLNITS